MKITGIIAEYNPFHLGHAYQLQEAKKLLKPDVLLVLMSGNVVQRGEFAFASKWQRAKVALEYGADIVVEAPILSSLQSADYFASSSLTLLSELACDSFVFGTKDTSLEELESYLIWEKENKDQLEERVKDKLSTGLAYPAALSQAATELGSRLDLSEGNQILGLRYLQTNNTLESKLEPYVIKRATKGVESASQIRKAYFEGLDISSYIPNNSKEEFIGVCWKDYWPYLRYQLLVQTPTSLRKIFLVKEGLEHALIASARKHLEWDDFIESLVSKRWTRSSIQRVLLSILLQIEEDSFNIYRKNFKNTPIVRVLATNANGRKYLNYYNKQDGRVKLFSNYRQEYFDNYAFNLRADNVYQANLNQKIEEQTIGRYPIML